ncbi:MAG: 4-hydroxy-3-methylbut-2-enyl diphosphate reductase [Deltaproteobacteria bacterium]|nr:4-hydroxy-3-methylbut-2-enyl diphosphate reductase [Deltaproteobacteria bacterium]
MSSQQRTILVASPRGFCAGVSYAVEIVNLALERYGAPVYVRHEIVHNRHVVQDLRAKGAVFVDDLALVPAGSLLIFSAHGVSPAVRNEAKARALRVIDATCPLVTRVHLQVLRHVRDGNEVVMIGHRGHVEVEGTMGQAPGHMYLVETAAEVEKLEVVDPDHLAVVTQTTLSVDDTRGVIEALRARFPNIRTPPKDDICYATQNRQGAVKALARQAEVVFVIGSPTSSNANRLVEVARNEGAGAHLIESFEGVDPACVATAQCVGVTSGASTPEVLVQQTIARLQQLGFTAVRNLETVEEHVNFPLPRELRRIDQIVESRETGDGGRES